MLTAWIALLLASIAEVWWTVALKYSRGFSVLTPSLLSIAGMVVSVLLLAYAVRIIPLGTAYAVWSGLGAAFTAVAGMVLFQESREAMRLVCIGLILAGVVGLKLFER
jgi:quaternary ammonium compound-resistance protein SugE